MSDDQFDVDAPLIQAYDAPHAAAYLGVTLARLGVLRLRGQVEAFSTGIETNNKRGWKYPVEGLRRYRALNAARVQRLWDPVKEDFPRIAVARLMGLSVYTIRDALASKALKSLSPLDVRDYMLKHYADKIGKDLKKYYGQKIQEARERNKLLTDRLVTQKCLSCGKKVAQHRFFNANARFKSPPKLDVAKELSSLLTRTSDDTNGSATENR